MRVAIVDDHPLARKGIILILAENKRIEGITECSNVKEALGIIERDKTDVVMVDLKLGEEDGLEVVSKGKSMSPVTRFIILTSFISQSDFLRAEKIGVDGYILKDAMAEDIIFVVDSVMRGKKYFDPCIIAYYKKSSESSSQVNQLTDREKEVLLELGKGISNVEIAGRLYISENTVKKHISSILSKLNLKHRTQVALFVKNMGALG